MDSAFSPQEFRNPALLSVMSRTFRFTHLKPVHPMLADLGVRRVACVLMQENWFPQVGLADPANPQEVEFFAIEDLDVAPDPDSRLPFPTKAFNSCKLRLINVQLNRAGSMPG